MRGVRHCLLMLTLFSTAATAQQHPPAADGPDIVVTAPRQTDDEVRDFVGALTATPRDGQLSRFETRAACPSIVGVPTAQAGKVVARMRRVATAAGVPLAKGDCVSNILVVVTRDKRAFIEALAKRSFYYFGDLTRRQIREIAERPGPAASWQIAGPQLNADGMEIPTDPITGVSINRTGRGASRITAPARPQYAAAMVVLEGDALVGLTTTQLADYAAMRAFAGADPERVKDTKVPTILTLLDAAPDAKVPVTLTSWDLSFLRGLYASPVNLRAAAQRSAIGKEMKKELTSADKPK